MSSIIENCGKIKIETPLPWTLIYSLYCGGLLCGMMKNFINSEKEAAGKERLTELLKCQHLVNKLVFEHHLAIEFLRAVIKDGGVVLQGVTNSAVIVERALHIASETLPEYSISSAISVVQDFKARM